MYNRYIGNTGKYYKVDEAPPNPPRDPPRHENAPPPPPPPSSDKKGLFGDLGGLFGNLGGLFKGKEGDGFLKSILPKNMDIGDILVMLILLFVYLESKDEEILIILIALFIMSMK